MHKQSDGWVAAATVMIIAGGPHNSAAVEHTKQDPVVERFANFANLYRVHSAYHMVMHAFQSSAGNAGLDYSALMACSLAL